LRLRHHLLLDPLDVDVFRDVAAVDRVEPTQPPQLVHTPDFAVRRQLLFQEVGVFQPRHVDLDAVLVGE
jgi:hypothetical protein